MIKVTGVSKSYGKSLVVDGVDLSLPSGGITAIVGANGAGKSTLLSMIARLLDKDAGTIHVGGLDVTEADSQELARTLAILRQSNDMPARLTVHDLVSFGRFPHSQGRLNDEDRALIDQAIEWMDLVELRDRFLDEMSGGQRQRAFVAMVLAQDTQYVLLDEPLNNLDVAHSQEMLVTLRRAADELGKTVVIVVHDINYASCWADQIVAMKRGKVIAVGTPKEIVREDLLQEIFGVEMEIGECAGCPIAYFYAPSAGSANKARALVTAGARAGALPAAQVRGA